jgi:hypothetical protein
MTTPTLPEAFLEKCTPRERSEVESWWHTLSEHNRLEVHVLLDRRNGRRAFVYADDEQGQRNWHELPIGDDDLPFDDPQAYERQWRVDYFQHLLDHPELVISPDAVVRTFHICVDHAAARRVAANGRLTCDFRCPVADQACPIRRFATGIQSAANLLQFDPATRLTTWLCQ